MADTLKFRGGSTNDIASSTVSDREIVFDTDENTLVLGSAKDYLMRYGGNSLSTNVGIGVPNPSSKLEVDGTVTATEFSGPLTGNVTGNVKATDGTKILENGTDGSDAVFRGNANTASEVTVTSSGFTAANTRPLAMFGTNSTPTGGTSDLKYPESNPPTVNGAGLMEVPGGITANVTGDLTGDVNATTISTESITASSLSTFNGNINIVGSSLKLRFKDSDGTNNAVLYSDGTDFRLELKYTNDFKIFNGNTLSYTFADNGDLTCTGSVTATSFVGNADTATTATTATTSDAVNVASSGFSDNINRPIACFGDDSTPSAGGSSQIEFPNSNAPTIKGDGLIRAKNGIEVTGNVSATGNITATGNLNGTLGSQQVRNAIALGNEGFKGTYAFCTLVNNTADRSAGYETSGSNLRYSNANANGASAPIGTWRLMGRLGGQSGDSNPAETSLWLRIS